MIMNVPIKLDCDTFKALLMAQMCLDDSFQLLPAICNVIHMQCYASSFCFSLEHCNICVWILQMKFAMMHGMCTVSVEKRATAFSAWCARAS